MAKYNLDDIRAARVEKAEIKEITFKGEDFTFPAEMVFDTADLFNSGKMTEGLRELFGDKDWARFRALKPTVPDVELLVETLSTAYGITDDEDEKAPVPLAEQSK